VIYLYPNIMILSSFIIGHFQKLVENLDPLSKSLYI